MFWIEMISNELLEKNFGVQFPEELDGTLDLQMANASCCRFNRFGTLVAVGATDGRIFIIDFITRGTVKSWSAHVLPVMGVSWSRDGRLLLTSSADTTVVVWDVLTAQLLHKFKYSAPIVTAQFNPRDSSQLLVLTATHPPSLESTRSGENRPHQRVIAMNDPLLGDEVGVGVAAVAFDRRGRYVITGTGKGRIVIYDVKTLRVLCIVKQPSQQQIRQIVIPRKGAFILTNSQDRVIRRYDLDDLLKMPRGQTVEPIQKLSDIVNKASWKCVCTSCDGDYICGASTKAHSLYVWERSTGSLIKILHGTKGESLNDVQWHPHRAVILSVANGIVSVWTQAHVENWSAFAPEFTELEENARYVEKEGEFDEHDEDADEEIKDDRTDSDAEEIDVVNVKASEMQCSSDEDDFILPTLQEGGASGPLWYLPVAPDIENPDPSGAVLPYADLMHMQPRSGSRAGDFFDDDLRRRSQSLILTNQSMGKGRRMAK